MHGIMNPKFDSITNGKVSTLRVHSVNIAYETIATLADTSAELCLSLNGKMISLEKTLKIPEQPKLKSIITRHVQKCCFKTTRFILSVKQPIQATENDHSSAKNCQPP